MSIEKLYEDENILVINKPPGVVVHPDGRNNEETISDWFVKEYPEAENVGEPIELSDGNLIHRPGIVHRLDRETSGVLVLAKNQESFLNLKDQFKNRETKKIYHTFAYGNIKEDNLKIKEGIGRSRSNIRMWTTERFARGKIREAETFVKVLNRGESNGELYVFLEVEPKTGRTHQIRVHLKFANHPIVCDSLYAPKRKPILGFERLALHARKLTFKKIDGEETTVEAPYPDDFNDAILGL